MDESKLAQAGNAWKPRQRSDRAEGQASTGRLLFSATAVSCRAAAATWCHNWNLKTIRLAA
jgi:hypothetical protein